MKIRMQFEASPEGNVLQAVDAGIVLRAVCPVPEGASEDYGYMALKAAVSEAYQAAGGNPEDLECWYDGQEHLLAEDAAAACNVTTDVDLG